MTDHKIRYDWARVSCPKCGAGPDEHCRTLTTNRVTDPHDARIQMRNLRAYRSRA